MKSSLQCGVHVFPSRPRSICDSGSNNLAAPEFSTTLCTLGVRQPKTVYVFVEMLSVLHDAYPTAVSLSLRGTGKVHQIMMLAHQAMRNSSS